MARCGAEAQDGGACLVDAVRVHAAEDDHGGFVCVEGLEARVGQLVRCQLHEVGRGDCATFVLCGRECAVRQVAEVVRAEGFVGLFAVGVLRQDDGLATASDVAYHARATEVVRLRALEIGRHGRVFFCARAVDMVDELTGYGDLSLGWLAEGDADGVADAVRE